MNRRKTHWRGSGWVDYQPACRTAQCKKGRHLLTNDPGRVDCKSCRALIAVVQEQIARQQGEVA